MRVLNKHCGLAFKAIAIAFLATFSFVTPHTALAQPTMPDMEHMSGGTTQCQNLCTSGILTTQELGIRDEDGDEEKKCSPPFYANAPFDPFADTPRVKSLHLQGSWRPPDRVLLFGHYSDGL